MTSGARHRLGHRPGHAGIRLWRHRHRPDRRPEESDEGHCGQVQTGRAAQGRRAHAAHGRGGRHGGPAGGPDRSGGRGPLPGRGRHRARIGELAAVEIDAGQLVALAPQQRDLISERQHGRLEIRDIGRRDALEPSAPGAGLVMSALFISDLHLAAERPATNDAFFRFLEETARGAQGLYILGDLFEYWLGDDDDDPLQREIIARRVLGKLD